MLSCPHICNAFVCLQRSDHNDDFIADLYRNEPTDTSKVAAYLACSDSSLDDLLEFWKRKSSVWPKLSTVAQTMLAVPATSTPSERVFSLAGRTLEECRTQLSADPVDSLLFLHSASDDKF